MLLMKKFLNEKDINKNDRTKISVEQKETDKVLRYFNKPIAKKIKTIYKRFKNIAEEKKLVVNNDED